jgi:hypothetical protein
MRFDEVAVVGGLIRDFARGGKTTFKSDIDLVINAPIPEIRRLAESLNATPNRFGGYSYSHPNWKIDFWALESTWALREGYVNIESVKDVTKATFFNWDSAIYEIKSRKLEFSSDYLENIAIGQMELNLAETPSVEGNLLRAIRRILLWKIVPGPALMAFIRENLNSKTLASISKTEKIVYGHGLVGNFENTELLINYLQSKEYRGRLSILHASQLRLPGI